MKNRGLVLCLVLLWGMVLGGYGQLFRNASFEGELLFETLPPEWGNCEFWSTPDIQPGFWGVRKAAQQGVSYVNIIVRNNGEKEQITQVLDEPLIADSSYFMVAHLVHVFANGYGPCRLNIWGGEDSCSREELLWKSPVVDNSEWKPYLISFIPKGTYSSISFEAEYISPNQIIHGSIAIDNLEGIFKRKPPLFNLPSDISLCEGEVYQLDVSYPGASYYWENGSIAPNYTISEPGIYTVTLFLPYIAITDSVRVRYENRPEIDLGNDTSFCIGESMLLDVSLSTGSFVWQDGSRGGRYEVSETGVYSVKYTSSTRICEVKDTIDVLVEDCEHFLEMPNVFSPNDDGINDVFKPMQMKGIREVEWYIIDRWGRRVYEAKELDTVWDGSLNGSPLPEGTYYWILAYREPRGARVERNGYVVLMR